MEGEAAVSGHTCMGVGCVRGHRLWRWPRKVWLVMMTRHSGVSTSSVQGRLGRWPGIVMVSSQFAVTSWKMIILLYSILCLCLTLLPLFDNRTLYQKPHSSFQRLLGNWKTRLFHVYIQKRLIMGGNNWEEVPWKVHWSRLDKSKDGPMTFECAKFPLEWRHSWVFNHIAWS